MTNENPIEQAVLAQTQANKELLDKIYASTEKTRKMFLWTIVISVLTVLLPLIGLVFAIPFFLNTYVSALSGKGLGL